MWVKAGHQTMGLENTVRVPVGDLDQRRAQVPCCSLGQPFSTLPIPPELSEGLPLWDLYLISGCSVLPTGT